MARYISLTFALTAFLALAACGGTNDGNFDVAFMDSEQNLFADGVRLSSGGQHVRAATRSGLVALDQQGEVIPALADRWNVTDGGSIFVFRLRDGNWPNGDELTAESVRQALRRAIRDLRGTSLGLDLAPVDEVRAMAGRVIEIRLASAMPDLLQLLAQPELGLTFGEGETGLMTLSREEEGVTQLMLKPPTERGLPEDEKWRDYARDIRVHAFGAAEAVQRFENGDIEVVLGGRLASLPLADTGPLSRGTVRLDPAIGLFGLQVLRSRGVLETPQTREAIAMTIDRQALASSFNVGGWVPTTRIVGLQQPEDSGMVGERWADLGIEERRQIAASRITAWRGSLEGDDVADALTLSLQIGDAPGQSLLFDQLRSQLATIGVGLVRAEGDEGADLVLVDRVARYAASRWFLNQFNCLLGRGLCSEEADILAGRALDENDAASRNLLLAQAEMTMMAENLYIPFGSPLRWSLVRGTVDGFSGNRWSFHPLPDMAVVPR